MFMRWIWIAIICGLATLNAYAEQPPLTTESLLNIKETLAKLNEIEARYPELAQETNGFDLDAHIRQLKAVGAYNEVHFHITQNGFASIRDFSQHMERLLSAFMVVQIERNPKMMNPEVLEAGYASMERSIAKMRETGEQDIADTMQLQLNQMREGVARMMLLIEDVSPADIAFVEDNELAVNQVFEFDE